MLSITHFQGPVAVIDPVTFNLLAVNPVFTKLTGAGPGIPLESCLPGFAPEVVQAELGMKGVGRFESKFGSDETDAEAYYFSICRYQGPVDQQLLLEGVSLSHLKNEGICRHDTTHKHDKNAQAIKQQNDSLLGLFNSMKQAVFAVNEMGIVVSPVSDYTQVLFGRDIEGEQVMELLFSALEDEPLQQVTLAMNLVYFADEFQWDLTTHLFPSRVESGGVQLRISYAPITDDDDLTTHILIRAEDLQEIQAVEAKTKAAEQAGDAKLGILRELAANDRPLLEDFFREATSLMDKALRVMGSSKPVAMLGMFIFRQLHTVKASAGSLQLTGITSAAHCAEDRVKDSISEAQEPGKGGDSDGIDGVFQGMAEVLTKVKVYSLLATQVLGLPDLWTSLLRRSLQRSLSTLEKNVEAPVTNAAVVTRGLTLLGTWVQLSDEANLKTSFGALNTAILAQGRLGAVKDEAAEAEVLLNAKEIFSQALQKYIAEGEADDFAGTASLSPVLSDRLTTLENLAKQLHDRVPVPLLDAIESLKELPLSTLFPRLHESVSQGANKGRTSCSLSTSGGETTLSRVMFSTLAGLLVHMVRNAMDHGIENERTRLGAGKPLEGRIFLRCSELSSDRVRLTLEDDGSGIDLPLILEKARERGLIGDDEIPFDGGISLIFSPGLSSKRNVTDMSGRGVGMDVVRAGVEELGGEVNVETCEGIGTTFVIDIPRNGVKRSRMQERGEPLRIAR